MEIKDIAPIFNENAKNGNLSLKQIAKVARPLSLLINYYPDAESISLDGVKVQYDTSKNLITISGNSSSSAGLPLNFQINLSKEDQSLLAKAFVQLPQDHEIKIPGLTWFKIKNASISLSTLPGSVKNTLLTKGFEGGLRCIMEFGSTQIPLTANYTFGDELKFEANLKNITLPSLSDLVQIVGGKESLEIPGEIDFLGKVNLYNLEFTTTPGAKGVNKLNEIGFSFGVEKSWDIIPQLFSISNLKVNSVLTNPLSISKTFGGSISGNLQLGKINITVAAEKFSKEQPWKFRSTIPFIDFGDLAEAALKEFSLPIDIPSIEFVDTALVIQQGTGDYSFKSSTPSDKSWNIPFGTKEISFGNLILNAQKDLGVLSGSIRGNAKIFGSDVSLEANLSDQLSISSTISKIDFSAIAEEILSEIDLPSELPNFSIENISLKVFPSTKEFSLEGISYSDWEIPLGVTGLVIDDVSFSIKRTKAKNNRFVTSGEIGGEISIAGVVFNLKFSFPGVYKLEAQVPTINLSAIIQDLAGSESLLDIPIPTSVLSLSLNNVTITAAPKASSVSIYGESKLGRVELILNKNKQGKWVFSLGIAPPTKWEFSSIDSSLAPLDKLNFSDTALVVSTANTRNWPISLFKLPNGVQISPGLNFMANLKLDGLGIDDLMNIESLSVSASVGTSPSNMVISAGIDGTFNISKNVSFGNMAFRLRPAPTNFSLGIKGELLAKLDKSNLTFVGAMDIRPIERSASFAATMLGEWKKPFDIQGLAVSNLAAEVGIGIVPPPATVAPIVGFAGTISIGSFTGSAAVKIDTVTPTKSMIAASFNELNLDDVVQTFCDEQIYSSIPADIKNTVLQVGFEDVGVYVVPQPTQIGELFYEQGFKFEGKMSVAGFNAEFSFALQYSKGLKIHATMDEINIQNLVIISGAGTEPKPVLDINLLIGEKPGINIACSVSILGISAQTAISISDSGFAFLVEGNIFNKFQASIQASGGNLKQGGDFYLKVYLKNDLISYLREEALSAINDAADSAVKELSNAQKEISKAQKKVNDLQDEINDTRATIKKERAESQRQLNKAKADVQKAENSVNGINDEIDKTRKIIKGERDRDAKNVKDAENTVKSAQNKVNGLQKEIEDTRKTIKNERARDTKRLRDAQKEVQNAQNKVNSIQGEINSSNRRISQLKSDIAKKKRWVDKSPWYRKVDRGIEFSAYAAAKGAEITALYTKIGGLETARGVANGVLEGAKQIVKGIEKAAKTFPIDADPRIVGLFTAKESANVALEAAKLTLKGIRAGINIFPIDADPRIVGLFTGLETAKAGLEIAKQALNAAKGLVNVFPIDADPRIVGLFTAKETANGALEVAKLSLEGVKATVGAMADVASFITEYGLGGILDVKEAMFEGQLNSVSGGSVQMALKLVLIKKTHNMALSFNFHDPLSGAKKLGEDLINKLK